MGKIIDKNDFWFIENNPITKVGVYPYLGKQISQDCEPDKIYYVLRPKEELFRKETLDSLRLIPLIDGHTMIGKDFTAPEDKGLDGTLGDNVSHDTDTIYNDLKIISNKMKEEIQNGKKELSLGYFCRYDKQPGTYKGQRYDYVQRDIIANHLALVDKGRMGADVRVYDSKNIPEGEAFAMDSIAVDFNDNHDEKGRFAKKENNNTQGTENKELEEARKTANFWADNMERYGRINQSEHTAFRKFINNVYAPIIQEGRTQHFRSYEEFYNDIEKEWKKYKKNINPYSQDTDEDIEWITVRGTHIPIKKGESKEQAVKNFLEGKRNGGTEQSGGEHKIGDKIKFRDRWGDTIEGEIEDINTPNKDNPYDYKLAVKNQETGSTGMEWIKKEQLVKESGGEKSEPEDKETKLSEKTTTTKNTSKSVIKTMVTNKAFFDNRINDPAAFKREMNYAFNSIYGELTEYERKEEANFDDIYETAVKHYLKAIGVPERLANHKNFGTINRISKFADQNKMLKGKDKEGFNEFLTEVFINYADEEDKGTPNINRLTERAIKQYKDYNSELKKSGQKKFGEDSMEYKTIQGEGKMADKKEKVAIDEDKRKIIDEIGGILKEAGLDDELIRTVIGKAEKIAYNKSEAGDEGEEVEEEVNEEETVEEGKDKKAAKDKCGKDEKKDEEAKKKELVKEFAKKEKLAKEVEDALGTFDHSEMTELEVAKYACDKLELGAVEGQELATLKGYLKGIAKAPKATFGYKRTVAADNGIQTEDAEFEKFANKGE